jgi:hypothetical protein
VNCLQPLEPCALRGKGGAEAAVIGKLRRTYREIVRAPAGRRFHRYHQRRRGCTGRWHTAVYGGAGLLLVIMGLALSLPPLVPGFLLWLPGLALIAAQFETVARALDGIERGLRRLYRSMNGHKGGP